jgi:hypothetical protein
LGEELFDADATAAGAGVHALHGDVLADVRLRNHETIDVEAVIVFGVIDRRLQALQHVLGDALLAEAQLVHGLLSRETTDRLRDQIQLLRADPERAQDGLRFV